MEKRLNPKKWNAKLLLLTLFASSIAALTYELVWSRMLSLIFGSHALATSSVLALYIGGIALGSFYGGKFFDRNSNGYIILAVVEGLIGVLSLISLFLFEIIHIPYLFLIGLFGGQTMLFNIAQFFLSALVLIPPTFLIGMSFPALVKYYHREKLGLGRSVAHAAGADTLGGALGIFLAGFVFVWIFGFFKLSIFASAINILLGILLYLNFKDQQAPPAFNPEKQFALQENSIKKFQKTTLILFFFSGFAALTLENVWIRFFNLIYGNSILSFSIVVATFLFGLGLGSLISEDLMKKVKDKILLFAFVELAIGVTSLLLLLVFPRLEMVFLNLFFRVSNYRLFMAGLTMISIWVLIIPTTLMGMTFPIISTIYADLKKVGSDIGLLFSVNSFGSILGSFLTGFVFFALFGLNTTGVLASIIYIGIAFTFLIVHNKQIKFGLIGLVVLIVTIIIFIPLYEPDFLYAGSYYHGARQLTPAGYIAYKNNLEEPLFIKQSPYSMVSVIKSNEDYMLTINGRTEASTIDAPTLGSESGSPLTGLRYSFASIITGSISTVSIDWIRLSLSNALRVKPPPWARFNTFLGLLW